jgi:hypothetical protein
MAVSDPMKADRQLVEAIEAARRANLPIYAVETEWREVDGTPVRVCRVVCRERAEVEQGKVVLG